MAGQPTARNRIHFQDEMSWKDLDLLPRDESIFFFTLAPVQGHGPHLPCGFGAHSAEAFALATAKEFCQRREGWHAIIAPHLPIGSHTYSLPGTLDCHPTIIRRILEDWGASLASNGFHYIMVISTHTGPGHIRAIEDACERVSRKQDIDMIAPMGPKISAYLAGEYDEKLQRLAGEKQEHSFAQDVLGGRWETSMALYLRPDLVKPNYERLKPVLIDPEELGPDSPINAGDGEGYLGSPHLANVELGKASVQSVARDFTELLFQLLRGEDVSQRISTPWEGSVYLYEYYNVTIVVLALIAVGLFWSLLRLLLP